MTILYKCGNCSEEDHPELNYCGHCGDLLMKKCSRCGSMEPRGETSCRKDVEELLNSFLGSKRSLRVISTIAKFIAILAIILLVVMASPTYIPALEEVRSYEDFLFPAIILLAFTFFILRKRVEKKEKIFMEKFKDKHPEYYRIYHIKKEREATKSAKQPHYC